MPETERGVDGVEKKPNLEEGLCRKRWSSGESRTPLLSSSSCLSLGMEVQKALLQPLIIFAL